MAYLGSLAGLNEHPDAQLWRLAGDRVVKAAIASEGRP
jgi:hypothetical protein